MKKEPTLEEINKLVTFTRDSGGNLRVLNVEADVCGEVKGSVRRDIGGDVGGNIYGGVKGDVWGIIRGNSNYASNIILAN